MSIIRSGLLEKAGVPHGFGTVNTVSSELPSPIFTLQQVHGNRIVVISDPTDHVNRAMVSDPLSEAGEEAKLTIYSVPEQPVRFTEGDALISNVSGIFIGIRTADCLSVLLADPRSGTAAAVHCGWRTLALGIAGEAVRTVSALSGNPAPEFLAALGPAIGPCCYEVGQEVQKALEHLPGFQAAFIRKKERLFMDLAAAARAQLLAAGIPGENMDVMENCTSCGKERFFSHRARRDEGRMISFVGARPNAPGRAAGAQQASRRRRR